jgi:hypothetical protein
LADFRQPTQKDREKSRNSRRVGGSLFMPTVTAPYVETQQVVTGFMYQLYIAEADGGPGITRLDIGPYRFEGIPPTVKYPEAVTNEMCPVGWQAIRWVTDESGASWLRWQGGILNDTDGEVIFQLTSNYPSSNTGAALYVYRGSRRAPERFPIAAPDYTASPPDINPRHDVVGRTAFAGRAGCAPAILLTIGALIAAAAYWRA